MKCEENGGCPIVFGTELVEVKGYGHCGRSLKGRVYPCHLTPAAFPRLRAGIAGEWLCEKCRYWYLDSCTWFNDPVPCHCWKPRIEEARNEPTC